MGLVFLLGLSIVFIVLATTQLKMHPFLALLVTAFGFGILSGMPLGEVVKSVNDGFGGTIGYIGIVILAGFIIGTFLERSGGAYRLASSILRLTGEKNVPLAMAGVGYIVSMPVFCDSAFVLLSSLMKALASRAGITLASCAIALSLGLYATHTMVPPTPGPVAAAGIIGADLGLDGDTAKALVVVAIGAGSLVVSHANDSYFWVVTQFSNMDVKTGYKLQTLGTLVQGLTAAVTVYALSRVLL